MERRSNNREKQESDGEKYTLRETERERERQRETEKQRRGRERETERDRDRQTEGAVSGRGRCTLYRERFVCLFVCFLNVLVNN